LFSARKCTKYLRHNRYQMPYNLWQKGNGYERNAVIYLRGAVFLRGLAGNHPLRTRSCCSKTSLMVQNDENATTPASVEPIVL